MATYSVNISLKDSAGSFVANSNAIVIFANCGYNSMDNTNTVIASDSSQTLSSEENLAKLIFAFSSDTAEITSTFDEYGFDSTSPDEDTTDTVNELKALDISTLPGYVEDMGNISNFKKFVVYSNLAFGYSISDGDSVAFEVTIGGVTPTAPTVTYEVGADYSVTPASPITVSGDINLVVTLNDGYKWDDVAQKITIDGNDTITFDETINKEDISFIDLNTLNKGVYFIKIITNNYIEIKKIIKKD